MTVRQRKLEITEAADGSGIAAPATSPEAVSIMDWIRRQPVWMVLAVASGTCAAINGVFAKL